MAGANASLVTVTPETSQAPALVAMVGGGTSAQRPTNPPLYFLYNDTTVGRLMVWLGSTLQWQYATPDSLGPQGAQGAQGYQGVQGVQGAFGRFYLQFPTLYQLLNRTGNSTGWTAIDCTAAMTAVGLTTASAALLQLEAGFAGTPGRHPMGTTLRVSGTNSISSSETLCAKLLAITGEDQGDSSSADTSAQFVVPFQSGSKTIYYNLTSVGPVNNPYGRIYAAGFLYP